MHSSIDLSRYLLPNNHHQLRNHPPWKAVHAYAGDPAAVGLHLDLHVREVLSLSSATSGTQSAPSSVPLSLPARPGPIIDAIASPTSTVNTLPLLSTISPSESQVPLASSSRPSSSSIVSLNSVSFSSSTVTFAPPFSQGKWHLLQDLTLLNA